MRDLLVRDLPDSAVEKLAKMKQKDGFTEQGWREWFMYLSRKANVVDSLSENVQEGTKGALLEKWVGNFAENLDAIRNGKSIRELVPPNAELIDNSLAPPNGSAIVVGRGPSLFKHKHAEILAKSDFAGSIVSSDGGLIPLLEGGVDPRKYKNFVVVAVDGDRDKIWRWFAHPLVEKYGKHITACLTTSVAHNVYTTCKKNVVKVLWFLPLFDDMRDNESFSKIQHMMVKTEKNTVASVQSGGNSGMCSWVIAWRLLRASPTCLIGLDLSYPKDTPLEDTHYYKTMKERLGGNVQLVSQVGFVYGTNPQFGEYYQDPVFLHYGSVAKDIILQASPFVQVLNCTEGGALHGEGITQMRFSQFLERFKN